ncbi:MAG: DUF3798 domain-containing protein [Clostridiales bacterium]|jgi:hypothetical protein|nr:DUF3798 domain-containing protein [Clostridiales bacterium]
MRKSNLFKLMLVLALTATLAFLPATAKMAAGDTELATRSTASILVNNKPVDFDAFNINGNNYFKLRDIAKALNGSNKQFEVDWDGPANLITLSSGQAYTEVGGELAKGSAGSKQAKPTTSKIYLDGKEIKLTAYNIGDNNYFKLRDLGQSLDFGIDWNGAKKTITINTSKGYTPEAYHIGIFTLGLDYYEDEYKAAEKLIKKYGNIEDGGMVKHIVLPDNFYNEQELVISLISRLADDPLMKAIIVNPGVEGTAAGFQKIKEKGREDILLFTNTPYEDPVIMEKVATVIVSEDYVLRGYYDILRAKNMGAKTFVHMSFPRHMGVYVLARRKAIYEEACKDLGIEFVFENVPDPASGDLGVSGAQKTVYDMMPRLVEKYGKDTVFFTTNTALHEPIIQRVVEFGALFVDSDIMSPLCGFPSALGLYLTAEEGDWPAIVKKIEADVVAKGMSGRVGCFPYSYDYVAGIGLCELAMNMIEGKSTSNMQNDIVKTFQAATPGCNWVSAVFTYPDGSKIDNYYLLSMDTYIFGQGYSGVFSEPFPEKYYNIGFEW